MKRLLHLVWLIPLLAGCSSAPRQSETDQSWSAYQARHAALAAMDSWRIRGRLALSDGQDGGSGQIEWLQAGDEAEIDFRGALGKGSWRLRTGPWGAHLQYADGREYHAVNLEQLLASQVGWQVPVSDLAWWIRGLASPAETTERQISTDGLLMRLVQSDWDVEFSRYSVALGSQLPHRLIASRDPYRVKLAVSSWQPGKLASDDG